MRIVTSPLAVLQTVEVVEAKLTGSRELACAAIWKGEPLRNWFGIASNVIVCEPTDTVKVCVTGVAAE